jgi:hypothetical protein
MSGQKFQMLEQRPEQEQKVLGIKPHRTVEINIFYPSVH